MPNSEIHPPLGIDDDDALSVSADVSMREMGSETRSELLDEVKQVQTVALVAQRLPTQQQTATAAAASQSVGNMNEAHGSTNVDVNAMNVEEEAYVEEAALSEASSSEDETYFACVEKESFI